MTTDTSKTVRELEDAINRTQTSDELMPLLNRVNSSNLPLREELYLHDRLFAKYASFKRRLP